MRVTFQSSEATRAFGCLSTFKSGIFSDPVTKIRANGNTLYAEAFDKSVQSQFSIKADVETPGSCIVPTNHLVSVLGVLGKNKECSIVVENNIMTISEPSGSWDIPAATGSKEKLDPIVATHTLRINATTLSEGIALVAPHLGDQKTNPNIANLFLDGKDGSVTMTATNGHSIGVHVVKLIDNAADGMSVAIPPDMIPSLSAITNGYDGLIQIETDGGRMAVYRGSDYLMFSLAVRQTPDFAEIVRRAEASTTEGCISFVVGVRALRESINKVKAQPDTYCIKLSANVENNGVVDVNGVSSSSSSSKFRVSASKIDVRSPVDVSGTVKTSLIESALAPLGKITEECVVSISKQRCPVVLKPSREDTKTIYIVAQMF